ncbi:MAG: 30S ribosomal protein S9 [Desulfobacterales bacterium]|nr:30S ribosomal protein S9 [Desulfobacterales bacterium]
MEKIVYYATGKRKTAIARTWMKYGNGKVTVNDQPINEYFKLESAESICFQPLNITNSNEKFDIMIKVKGGGSIGQANAIRHGITKALLLVNPELRQVLKKAGFVRRDPRSKERKKYGQRAARARFQFSKR